MPWWTWSNVFTTLGVNRDGGWRPFHPLPTSPASAGEGFGAGRIGTAGLAVGRPRASGSRHSVLGQGGPVASATANGSTGGSPMKKPSISRISSGFSCNQSQVLSGFLSCS